MLVCLFDSNLVGQPAACARLMSSCLICLGMYCCFLGVGSFVLSLNEWLVSSPPVTLWTLWIASPVTPNACFLKNQSPPIPDILSQEGQDDMAHQTQHKLIAVSKPVKVQADTQKVAPLKLQSKTYLIVTHGDFSLKPFSRITLLITTQSTIQYKIF